MICAPDVAGQAQAKSSRFNVQKPESYVYIPKQPMFQHNSNL